MSGKAADNRAGLEGQNTPERLLAMTSTFRPLFQEAGCRLPIFLEFLIKAGHSPVVRQAMVAPFRKYHTLFAGMIQAGIDEGALRPVDPDRASKVLLAYAVGILALGLLDPHGDDWGQVAEDGLGMFLAGAAAERGWVRGDT